MAKKLLKYAFQNNASDLHLSCENFPMMRIDGSLVAITSYGIINKKKFDLILRELISEKQIKEFEENLELDCAVESDNIRFRANIFKTINGISAVFRAIKSNVLTLEEIGAPEVLSKICQLGSGLVLVTGATGSGKSTTLCAMINKINELYSKHIITIEDPVEYIYKSNKSLINQREVGKTTHSFAKALKSALREDPDVILVGEMRDLETIKLALTAAETGHLVFSTLHTNSAPKSINRIIDIFPSGEKNAMRSMLSTSLRAVISQRLLKKKDGGRIGAFEIMLQNTSIANLIREDKIPQIASMIEVSTKSGMISMKDAVVNLLESGLITKEVFLEQGVLNKKK